MHIAIFGAGSVGGYVGGRMADAGVNVTLVDGFAAHVDAIRSGGLQLTDSQGERKVKVNALHLNDIHQLVKNPVDAAIICVKSYDTAWLTTLAADYLSKNGVVVSMQNSVNEPTIAKIVGWDRTVGCVLNTIGVEMKGPGKILRWMKPAPKGYAVFRVGEMHGQTTPRAQKIADALGTVDNAMVTPNLWGERWTKLVNNAMQSGIQAIAGIGIIEQMGNPDTRKLSIEVMKEAVRVGLASGLRLEKFCGTDPEDWVSESPDAAEKIEAGLRVWQERIDQDGTASTLHDIRRGRRTEIDFINGLVAAKGAEVGVPTPLNTELTSLVHKVERGELKQSLGALSHLIKGDRRRAA